MKYQQQPAAAPVLYTADGHPLYATAPQAAPLVPYQPAAPVVLHQAPYLAAQHQFAADPARDPWPARLLCGGIGVGAAGVGVAFLLQAVAAATTGLGCLAAVLALAWLLKNSNGGGGGRGGAVNVSLNVSNRMTNRNR
ncbi:hypothetical protein ACFV4M_26190 [Kitasatospora indigofera]|uniref:hypothetical protein n=1 Tax=Kitasatospora indigofera TaxID=67307 RepID=UPI0036650109